MRLKFAVSTAVALLIATGATRGWAEKGTKAKHEAGSDAIDKQLDWENRVVGPKEGLDHDRLAAIQEKGRRDEEARKKEPPKKQERAAGIEAAGTATIPTQDIEKPAASKKPSAKKVAAAEPPRRKDSLDNLLDEQGAKPYSSRASESKSGNGGLDNLFASDDKPSRSGNSGGAKKSKKTRRR
jgi:hypothetical protein